MAFKGDKAGHCLEVGIYTRKILKKQKKQFQPRKKVRNEEKTSFEILLFFLFINSNLKSMLLLPSKKFRKYIADF